MVKNLILDLIYASWALFFNLTSSVNRNHGQLSSCQISEKTNDPFLRKLNDGWTEERTDRQTDESDFIQCCSTNVKTSTWKSCKAGRKLISLEKRKKQFKFEFTTEAVAWRCSTKKVFLKVSSQQIH